MLDYVLNYLMLCQWEFHIRMNARSLVEKLNKKSLFGI